MVTAIRADAPACSARTAEKSAPYTTAPTQEEVAQAQELAAFIRQCPSMFHTAAALRERLDAAGFVCLPEGAPWRVVPGGTYYVVRNNSSVIAFKVGERCLRKGMRANAVSADVARADEGQGVGQVAALEPPLHFQITASHADSPTFKLKAVAELEGPASYTRLNVEAYGGMIDYTWFDRPLSVAGRVLVRQGSRVESRLLALNDDLVLIPSVAVHLQRDVNSGFAPNRAVDLCPLFSAGALGPGSFDERIAAELGVEPENVLARDLFLYNRVEPRVGGRRRSSCRRPGSTTLCAPSPRSRRFWRRRTTPA